MKNEEDKKEAAIKAIKLNARMYNLTALVVVFTLMLIIVNSATSLIDYIPKYSIVALLAIVSILVIINFHLSNKGAINAIKNLHDYEQKVNKLLIAMEKEMDTQKLTREQLKDMPLTDELTGLHNRHGFMPLAEQYLKTLQRNPSTVYIFYADIDNIKHINDTYGHHEGNSVIKTVADILQDTYSGSDLIAKIGDNEFAVLPVGSTESGVELINSRLQDKFDEANAAAGKEYTIAISYGVAKYSPEAPCSIEDLLTQSEMSMREQRVEKQNS